MNPIGGYFELELPQGEEYHKNAIRLNTGRNAFEYVLRAKQYKKAYLPYYTCDVMLEPIKKLGIDFEFYHIDNNFLPVFDFSKVKAMDVFVYTNYFGICDNTVNEVSEQCKNIIVDNSQAFFYKPLSGVDTIYSPRKFFGLPDGAYLYADTSLNEKLETDISYQRFEHLLGRIDLGAEKFYAEFQENDESFINQPIKTMSKLTQKLLLSIDYKEIAKKRVQNFEYLHSKLSKTNQLSLNLLSGSVPMVYPYLVRSGEQIKKKLIKNKVFVATYWPNVIDWCGNSDTEFHLFQHLIPLPIDQRYSKVQMAFIIKHIKHKF